MIGHRQLTMEDYAAIFRRHRRTLIVMAILGPALGYFLCLVLPKEYTSQTVVLVKQPVVPTSYVTDISSGDVKQQLTTLQEQILSRSRLESMIDKLGLFPKERGKLALHFFQLLFRRRVVGRLRAYLLGQHGFRERLVLLSAV